jgi:preprotein translocase subunit SecY
MGASALLPNGAPTWFNYMTIGISLAAGTAFTMWLGEQITEHGIGNGISLIIFIGIIARFPLEIIAGLQTMFADMSKIWILPLALVGILALIAVIVFVDEGERRVPVQYAKRVVGRKMYGGQSTHIPLKVNASGVMPLIFAISILQFPGIILQFGSLSTSAFGLWWNQWMNPASGLYMGIFAVLIVFFAFFYSSIQFNPMETAKHLQQNGGFVPGIRPGKPTSDYLARSVNRITLAGSLFLAVIATIPSIILVLFGVQSPFTATGILIVVSVALETSKQLEAQMLMRHYKGFMR